MTIISQNIHPWCNRVSQKSKLKIISIATLIIMVKYEFNKNNLSESKKKYLKDSYYDWRQSSYSTSDSNSFLDYL